MAIIIQLKNALEFARFADPNIRESMVDAINELAADMKEVEFEEAVATRKAFERLGAAISNYENREVTSLDSTPEEDIDDTPTELITTSDDVEIEHKAETVEIDEDDIEL